MCDLLLPAFPFVLLYRRDILHSIPHLPLRFANTGFHPRNAGNSPMLQYQNYLRRKANGKQKEWEERYNARRKAQVEAAKAAIRAEDMEKGIFIPVSQLPRQEPRKATVLASAAV